MATFIHGIYDYNLLGLEFFSGSFSDVNIAFTIQMLILALSLYITKRMANHLVILTNKQRKKIGNKN